MTTPDLRDRFAMATRTLQWATDSGHVILQWPVEMSPADAEDALAAVRLACRAIERLAADPPAFAEYEAALRNAMESS